MIALLDGLAGSFCHRFAFISFICVPHDCFAGWLGRIILPQVCSHLRGPLFHFFSFVPRMIALLDGLAGSFGDRFVFISFHVCPA